MLSDELKQLIEAAAKLLGLSGFCWVSGRYTNGQMDFNPLDPDRGDLMKVARVGGFCINHTEGCVSWVWGRKYGRKTFMLDNYQSLVLAVLRAASAVLKARGE